MIGLVIVNLGCLRTCLQNLHAWENGKIVLMGFLVLAMCIVAIVQDNGSDKVEDDYDMNVWFIGLFGVLSGFIVSLLGIGSFGRNLAASIWPWGTSSCSIIGPGLKSAIREWESDQPFLRLRHTRDRDRSYGGFRGSMVHYLFAKLKVSEV